MKKCFSKYYFPVYISPSFNKESLHIFLTLIVHNVKSPTTTSISSSYSFNLFAKFSITFGSIKSSPSTRKIYSPVASSISLFLTEESPPFSFVIIFIRLSLYLLTMSIFLSLLLSLLPSFTKIISKFLYV